MSVFSYNSVSLPYALHLQFQQKPLFDPSNTDKYATEFDITVQGVVNPEFNNFIGVSGASSGAIMKEMRARWMTPRKKLSITVGDTELIPASLREDGRDAINGPHPQEFSVQMMTNTTFLVTYRIKAAYCEDETGATSGNDVVYNRWDESVDIDEHIFTTRTRTGEFRIRADNSGRFVPDDYRKEMAFLALPQGWRRMSSRYQVSTDGLILRYTTVDKEIFKQPPKPAYTAEGEYYESSSNIGALMHGFARVRLRGSKETVQHEMLGTAISVAHSKLIVAGAQLLNGRIAKLEHSKIYTNLYENEVAVEAGALMKRKKDRFKGGVQSYLKSITTTPLTDNYNLPNPDYKLRGTGKTLLQAASYYDPSLYTLLTSTNQLSVGTPPGN